ncbi:MAG: DUF1360 domain-containing protein [Candidatus Pacearchaeota archaeon]
MEKQAYKFQNFWNFTFSVLFILVAFYLSYKIIQTNPRFLTNLGVLELTIISLATFRMIRLVAYNKIMSFLRDFFERKNSFMRTIYELIICPWCVGIWMALAVLSIYFLIPGDLGKIFISIIAIAGLASLIQSLALMMERIGFQEA